MPNLLVIPLSYPTIILPGASLSVSLNAEIGQQLVTFMQDLSGPAVLAAVPFTNPKSNEGETPVLSEWGCAVRITRLVRPSALNRTDSYVVSLHGITRLRLAEPLTLKADELESLPLHPFEYPPKETTPNRESVRTFKSAAFKLLDHLVQDAGKSSRREAWTRLANMVEDISDSRATWMADVMVWSIVTDYEDRLGKSSQTLMI